MSDPKKHSPGLIQHYKNLANNHNPIDCDGVNLRNAAQYWLDKNGYSKPVKKRSKSLLDSLANLFGGGDDD